MKTNFVHARVRVAPGLDLVVDGNSKITAGNGTFEKPVPNALSLPSAAVEWSGPSCPGATPTCRATCYTRSLAKHAPEVYAAYRENLTALTWLLSTPTRYEAARRLGAWIAKNARGGFRWHVSGDVLNFAHAQWIVDTCHASPDVGHWIYTRTFEAVPALTCAKNLTVNVSADVDNYALARDVATTYGLRVCYEATGEGRVPADLPDDAVIFPDYALRGRDLERPTSHVWWQETLPPGRRHLVCPADFFSQSESLRCGMERCSKCLVRTT